MSNEIKQGDKVRVSRDIPQFYRRYNSYRVFEVEHQVVDIEDGLALLDSIPSKYVTTIPTKYLVKVEAEAKEAKYRKDDKVCINKSSLKHGLRGEILTIIGVDVSDRTYYVQSRCMRSPIWLREDEISPYVEPTEQTEAEKTNTDSLVAEINKVIEGYCKAFADIADSFDWQHYAADLAKEIVLKTVNSASDRRPMAIAEYATDIAKAVVEGLKRK